jgi:alpha-galactosidase
VQVCAETLLNDVGLRETDYPKLRCKIAGINHMGWLLEIADGKNDLYPQIKKLAAVKVKAARKKGAKKLHDMVRLDMMRHFGYYITESSEHAAEYYPYWIKTQFPELIEEFNIPLDEYPRRCREQIASWEKQRDKLLNSKKITHKRTKEYASWIMEAMETDVPARIGGNVLNHGLISNLPDNAVVEVPCLVDRNGIQGCYVGVLPAQLAALNQTHINVHQLVIEAALEKNKEKVYQAASLDPHLAAELPLDQIHALVTDLFKAHRDWLPRYR